MSNRAKLIVITVGIFLLAVSGAMAAGWLCFFILNERTEEVVIPLLEKNHWGKDTREEKKKIATVATPGEREEGNTADNREEGGKGEASGPVPLRLALVGDVLLGGLPGEYIARYGPYYPWEKVRPLLEEADLAIGNLEGPVAISGEPVPDKQFTFRAHPEALKGARWAGIDIFTLANNHILDYGPPALRETLIYLDTNGLKYAGAGLNLAAAQRPVVISLRDMRVGILAFSRVLPVTEWAALPERLGVASGYYPEQVLTSVRRLVPEVDVVVVSLHWGEELAEQPRPEDVALARQLIEAGATVVVGHHPHVLQGVEFYRQGIIAYSLGNFIFTSRTPRAWESMVLLIDVLPGRVASARAVPVKITDCRPVPLSVEDADYGLILNRLQQMSRGWGTKVNKEGLLHP